MKSNVELKVVSYENDWDYGLKTLSKEEALVIAKTIIDLQDYNGVAYVTELSKDYIEFNAEMEENEHDIKYETPYEMLESWSSGLGIGFAILPNGNALYVTTEL
jgi:hypothetical protein